MGKESGTGRRRTAIGRVASEDSSPRQLARARDGSSPVVHEQPEADDLRRDRIHRPAGRGGSGRSRRAARARRPRCRGNSAPWPIPSERARAGSLAPWSILPHPAAGEESRSTPLETRAFGLADPARIAAALRDIDVVLHCAGPFSRTALPMFEACLADSARTMWTSPARSPSAKRSRPGTRRPLTRGSWCCPPQASMSCPATA